MSCFFANRLPFCWKLPAAIALRQKRLELGQASLEKMSVAYKLFWLKLLSPVALGCHSTSRISHFFKNWIWAGSLLNARSHCQKYHFERKTMWPSVQREQKRLRTPCLNL